MGTQQPAKLLTCSIRRTITLIFNLLLLSEHNLLPVFIDFNYVKCY